MTQTRIGIIGGGLAGLTTAYKLSKEKFPDDQKVEITLLEARSDIGGRVHTLRDFSDDMYAEAGALTLCDNEFEIQTLVKELGLELIDRSSRSEKWYHSVSQHIPWDKSQENSYFIKYILANIPKSIYEVNSPECINLDKINMDNFIKQKVFENNQKIKDEKHSNPDDFNIVLHAIKISVLGLYCDDFSKLSALNGFRWISQYLTAKKSYSIKGGNDQLPKTLAKTAKENGVIIRNSTAVINIKRPMTKSDFTDVIVTVIHPDKQKESLEFDYIVIALPLSALKKMEEKSTNENCIEFDPPLSKVRQNAIDNISYNRSIARVYFEFNNRFWRDTKKIAMTITGNPTVWIEDHTDHLETKSAILEVHASGHAGKLLQINNPIESAKKELDNVWGDDINKNLSLGKPVEYIWSKEFYQKGSYAYLGVGQAHYPSLISKKLPSISFAGEYTDILSPASMNGAIKSALRVVNELKIELVSRKINKKNNHSKNSYSFWLKTGAIVVGLAATGMAFYNTYKPR